MLHGDQKNKQHNRKLIAIDMDGTLIGENGISNDDKEAILAAESAGHIVAIVSGRSDTSVAELLKEEGLDHLPISGSNGAITIVDAIEINRVSMPVKLVEKIVDYLDGSYPYLIYTSLGVFSKETFLAEVKAEFESTPGAKGSPFESYEFMAEYSNNHDVKHFTQLSEIFTQQAAIFKVFAFLPNPNKKEKCSQHVATFDDVTITSSYVDNISISSASGHKGTGLQALAEHFNVPIEHTIAIGDNLNDLGMLHLAGLSIAMGNAEPEVKTACDVTTLSNLQSGVAHAIHQYVLT